jgi:hypothetical protein
MNYLILRGLLEHLLADYDAVAERLGRKAAIALTFPAPHYGLLFLAKHTGQVEYELVLRAAADRSRLSMSGLSDADRQRLRPQYVDREELRRGGPQPAQLGHADGGHREATRGVFLRQLRERLWSKYHAAPGDTLLMRVGTLDHPERVEPDVHIFTRSKLPWFQLPPDQPAFEAFYKIPEVWPAASQERPRCNIARQS